MGSLTVPQQINVVMGDVYLLNIFAALPQITQPNVILNSTHVVKENAEN